MSRKLSEILKDRNIFTEEQENRIHQTVQQEVKKYQQNEDVDMQELNRNLQKYIED